MNADLMAIYPELSMRVSALCQGAAWCLAGASALVHDEQALYWEITKPKHWIGRPDGDQVAGLGGIGGSLECGETVLACLYREAAEELGVPIEVESATKTYLVYEQHIIETLALAQRGHPLPIALTISANLHPHERHPTCKVLAIVTFLARLSAGPTCRDLCGLLAVPFGVLPSVFGPAEVALEQVVALPGVRLLTQASLPAQLLLRPVWTGRSFQLLFQAGCL
jgi:hypothetical protein